MDRELTSLARDRTARKQRGFIGLLIALTLLIVAGSILLVSALQSRESQLAREIATRSGASELDKAFATFVAVNKRLPCPAAPTDATGMAAGTTTCTSPDGVLPWGSLGLPPDAALDKWTRKYSYRVYAGASGFTQTNGLNAIDCNTAALLTTTAIPLDVTSGLCASAIHGTRDTDFLTGKGLTVNDNGTPVTGVAYVVISHGATGIGSYSADHSNTRMSLPNAAGKEYINTTSAADNTYWLSPISNTSSSSDATFFDDVITYRKTSDLLVTANVQPRDWGWVTLAKSFSPSTFTPNAATPQSTLLTITLTNSSLGSATLLRSFTDTLPTGLVAASSPSATTTCTLSGAFSVTAGATSITLPVGSSIPAATKAGGIVTNGTCQVSVLVTSNVVVTGTTSFTNTLPAGSTSCPTAPLSAVSYLCTGNGWNLAAASATVTATLTPPVLNTVSPNAITGSSSAQTITFTGTSFNAGANITFTNVTASSSSTVAATYVNSTQLTATNVFGISSSAWTARVTNPDGQSSGTRSITVNAPPTTQALSAAVLTAAGFAPSGGCLNTAQNPFTIGTLTITAFATFSSPRVSATASGIGVGTSSCSGGTITSNATNQERLRFDPNSTVFSYLGIQLNGLSSSGADERATLNFYSAGGTLLQSTQLTACTTSAFSNFYVDVGQTFAYVDIVGTNRSNGSASTFLVGSIAFCGDSPATACVPTNIGTAPVVCP